MATYFCNSSGAGDYLESDGVTRTWAAGNDANDGSSRLQPKLTPNYMSSATGDKHVFNRGSYSFTAGGGRLIVIDGFEIESAQQTEDSVLIDFVGNTQTQAIRTNSVSSESTITISKGVTVSGSGTITDLTWIYNAGSSKWVLNFGCKFRLSDSVVRLIHPSTCDQFDLNFSDGFGIECSDSGVTLDACIELSPSRDCAVNIQHFAVNWTAGNPGPNLLKITYPANAGGSFYSVIPHGSMSFTSTEDLEMIRLINPPDKATAEQRYNATANISNTTYKLNMVQFDSPSANSSQSDDCLIFRQPGNTARFVTNAQTGFGALLGDNSDTDTNGIDGTIYNLDIRAGAYGTGDFHALMHGGSTGYRIGNRVEGVGIGSLSKNSSAVSIGNEMHRVNTTDGEYCFAKGSSSGCAFINDKCYVYDDTEAMITKATDSGLQDAQNPLFEGIQVIYKGGQVTGYFAVDGDGSDTSEGTRRNMMIDSRIDVDNATAFYSRGGTDYTVAQALAFGSNPSVGIKELRQGIPGASSATTGIIGEIVT